MADALPLQVSEHATCDWVLSKMIPDQSMYTTEARRVVVTLMSANKNYAPSLFLKYGKELQDFEPLSQLTRRQCEEIITDTVKNNLVETYATAYMLAEYSKFYANYPLNSAGWQFMSGYLQVMFLLTSRGDRHFSKVHELGVRVRMALHRDKTQLPILNHLIEIHSTSTTLVDAFDKLKDYEIDIKQQEASGQILNNHLGSKVSRIRLAYQVIIENKPFISKRVQGKGGRKTRNSEQYILDKTDYPVRKITPNHTTNKSLNRYIASAETIADEDAISLLDNNFRPSKYTAKSAELQRWEVRNQARHSRRNQFAFPSNPRVLNLSGYQILFAELWQQLHLEKNKLPKRRGTAVLLLSLLSGQSITDVCDDLRVSKSERRLFAYDMDIKASKNPSLPKDEIPVFNLYIDITPNRRASVKKYRQSYDNTLHLPLPAALQVVLQNKFEVASADIDDILSTLKSKLGLPILSRQHIESALSFISTHCLNRPLHADLLTGTDVKHSAPLYYTSIKTQHLLTTYDETLKLLTKKLSPALHKQFYEDFPVLATTQSKPYIGSEMTLKASTCQKFFEQITDYAESYNGRLVHNSVLKEDRYIKQFNAYGVWLWHIIQIQTGIRPVNDAPGFLNQFNFEHRLLWVSDKENKDNQRQGRLIPLTDFAMTAVQNYVEYLQAFSAIHNVIYPEHPLPIEQIMNSQLPLLQIFSFNPKGFMSIKPSRIRHLLGKFFVHQDNWLRHQLRSMLTDQGNETLVCALFGHEHPSQEMMHPMSSASIYHLKTLTRALDNVAHRLKLRQVQVALS